MTWDIIGTGYIGKSGGDKKNVVPHDTWRGNTEHTQRHGEHTRTYLRERPENERGGRFFLKSLGEKNGTQWKGGWGINGIKDFIKAFSNWSYLYNVHYLELRAIFCQPCYTRNKCHIILWHPQIVCIKACILSYAQFLVQVRSRTALKNGWSP